MSFQIGAVNIGHLIKNVNINLFLPNSEEDTRKIIGKRSMLVRSHMSRCNRHIRK